MNGEKDYYITSTFHWPALNKMDNQGSLWFHQADPTCHIFCFKLDLFLIHCQLNVKAKKAKFKIKNICSLHMVSEHHTQFTKQIPCPQKYKIEFKPQNQSGKLPLKHDKKKKNSDSCIYLDCLKWCWLWQSKTIAGE